MGGVPQLKMTYPCFDTLPEPVLSDGYTTRNCIDDVEFHWTDILVRNGELGEWNLERARSSFSGGDRVLRAGIHIVYAGDSPVATACIQLHDAAPGMPELGWVAVVPEHQGKGLGAAVSLAVLHSMRNLGYGRCYLWTDDHRLAAIKTYCRLGFIPSLEHGSYLSRWKSAFLKLGIEEPVSWTGGMNDGS